MFYNLFYLLVASCLAVTTRVKAQSVDVPALFVFGDSLVDVGNNNHLKLSLAKANFPHNGVDFTTRKPTGRFSNGKNAADFFGEEVGLGASPPYLSLSTGNGSQFLGGVNFASGGAGIFDSTSRAPEQSIPLGKQVDYFFNVSQVLNALLGPRAARDHLGRSLFAIAIGSNDILGHFGSGKFNSSATDETPPLPQFVARMAQSLGDQIKRIYTTGGRKMLVVGVGMLGCCPAQRLRNQTGDCHVEANSWSSRYNQELRRLLNDLASEMQGMKYAFFDTFAAVDDILTRPASYGFREVRAACCGSGRLKAQLPCLPVASFCSNRTDHFFWDLYHPTEAASRAFTRLMFDGPPAFNFPVNARNLLAA